MTPEKLKEVLESHSKWVGDDPTGKRANLRSANLYGANLYGANLSSADLYGANLSSADLYGANLYGANLRSANLYGANLSSADLYGANLSSADLYGANLRSANLSSANLRSANLYGANLYGANLSSADLYGATLPHFQIVPSEGAFIGWKKTTKGVIKLLITEDSERTSTLIGRKCRASKVVVIDGPSGGTGPNYSGITYNKGEVVESDYDNDIRVECTQGIHFFMTEKEAQEW